MCYKNITQSKFIAIEGIDGSGKDTLIQNLKVELEKIFILIKKKPLLFITREPTERASVKINSYFKENEATNKIDNRLVLNLFLGDREDHSGLIQEKLSQGYWVITNRYDLSTYAYQGDNAIAANNSFGYIYQRHHYGQKCFIPDFTFFLEISLETAWQRIKKRNKKKEYYEKTNNLKKITKKYYQAINYLTQKDRRRIIFLKENLSLKKMVSLILQEVGLKN